MRALRLMPRLTMNPKTMVRKSKFISIEGRVCAKCNIYKPAPLYYLRPDGGLRSYCIRCARKQEKVLREKRLQEGKGARNEQPISKRQKIRDEFVLIKVSPSKLKTERECRGLSQRDVQEILGLSRNALHHYENGYREPSGNILARLMVLYRVNIHQVTDNPCKRYRYIREKP